ncbi:MAG: methionine--tRNA ligase [Candidatus Bathyarchaeota archaeon]|nr:MAG: methionine--tRNA ligase [Candidatus Bathyarchaeota archaeon]
MIITAALPYANAKLHLGHLRSTYIPADIYTRYLRLKGKKALYICATDEHGTPIVISAEKERVTPKEIVDKYSESILNDLKRLGCSFDNFYRTTSSLHYQLTQHFFSRLLKKGFIYQTNYEQLFCPKCNRFLPDRYVEGICPSCGGEKARGDQCEACGRYLKTTELKTPYCANCGTTPETRSTNHWFFKLSAFQNFLDKWIANNKELPPNVKNYSLQWLHEGLKDWCITRDQTWGVPVPFKEGKGKVIYVWFDAPIGYISSTIEWAHKYVETPDIWRDFWQKDESEIIHFIGKDIIYHHAIFWPAMLHAHGKYRLPYKIVAGEYLTLEGRKMSKSRGWAVEIEEYLKNFDPDPLRYYLTVVGPIDKDADFSWGEYIKKNNDELADILGNFVHRSLMFTYNYYDKCIPKPEEIDEEDKQIIEEIERIKQSVEKLIDQQHFNRALREIISLSATGNKYLNAKKPWKQIHSGLEKAATTLYITNLIVKALAILLEPFLPFTAEKIWETLNLDGNIHEQNWDEITKMLTPSTIINKPTPLFKKIKLETAKTLRKYLEKKREKIDGKKN